MLEDELARFVRQEIAAQTDPFQLLVVDSVQANGTVNLKWGTDVLTGIPCNQSYVSRKDGDVVLVIRHSGGWRVIDKIGDEHRIEYPPIPSLAFGTAQPSGSGWVKGEAIWVQDGAIYIQTGVGPGLPGDPLPPQSGSIPLPVTVSPTTTAGYVTGLRNGTEAKQGAWGDFTEPWTGAWFYGTQISAACAGRTVTSMEIQLTRSSTPHGMLGKATPRLHTHSNSTPPNTTPQLTNEWAGLGLGIGAAEWSPIPNETAQALATGEVLGIAASAPPGLDYIVYEPSGDLLISFS